MLVMEQVLDENEPAPVVEKVTITPLGAPIGVFPLTVALHDPL